MPQGQISMKDSMRGTESSKSNLKNVAQSRVSAWRALLGGGRPPREERSPGSFGAETGDPNIVLQHSEDVVRPSTDPKLPGDVTVYPEGNDVENPQTAHNDDDSQQRIPRREVPDPRTYGSGSARVDTDKNGEYSSHYQNANASSLQQNPVTSKHTKLPPYEGRLQKHAQGPTEVLDLSGQLQSATQRVRTASLSLEHHPSDFVNGNQTEKSIVASFDANTENPIPPEVVKEVIRINTIDVTVQTTPATASLRSQIQKLTEALQRAETDRDQAKSLVQETKNSYETALKDARENERETKKNVEIEFRAEMGALEAKLNAKTKELTEAQSNFKALQESKDVLDQEMEVANDHIKEMEEGEQEMLDTIERVRGDLGPQLSREHFQESYGELRNEIQYWSQDFFKGDIHGHPSASSALRKLSDECNDYLNSPELRVKLVQAYIWAVLVREVFADIDGLWWASPYHNELYGLRALLEPSASQLRTENAETLVREYHRWRATTARLVSAKRDGPMLSDSLGVIVGRTLDKLVPFVSNKGLQRGTAERDSRLRSIFVLAVRMDQEINMQFASYFLAIPRSADQLRTPFGFLFNSEEMKVDATMAVRDGREKCDFVGLVVAPTLFVKGDPNGGNFLEPATVLEKCTVMPRSALSRKSHRDADAEHKGSRKRAESQRPKGSYSRMWI